ncbi:FAD-dependent oxidoreductase [Sulfuracidifex metallicus]|uniref:FAD-binding FR-type domain-containing protein n=1 Tax=Sulfuracidifex metallicus DSM 6482 = JCM 9184 TaxID=523847 RepID=A0A6A9QTG1_SULME|nr:FAD-dependent oxidoreductase [Sulfuracidifex metallicus]MUN29053.1 hypothetical protein [Sulfuracidifex metallicus DSM 6482 = JCM 9184]WOE50436.1 FAD-dependent oxidoreductase [Sulfuracidifex metallicus DSM 6482 = JCM 9184]
MKAKIESIERKGKYIIVTLDKTIDFKPGNTVDVVLNGDRRTFSIASMPGEKLTFATVDSGSKFKKSLQNGTEVEVEGPFEDEFVIKEAEDHVFVAKGIGITPVRPMYLTLKRTGKKVKVFYESDERIFDDVEVIPRMPSKEDVEAHKDGFFYISGTPTDTKEITVMLVNAGVKPGRFVSEPFSGYE